MTSYSLTGQHKSSEKAGHLFGAMQNKNRFSSVTEFVKDGVGGSDALVPIVSL